MRYTMDKGCHSVYSMRQGLAKEDPAAGNKNEKLG